MVDCYTTFPYVDLRANAATSIPHNAATFTKVNLATTTHNDTAFYTVTASVVEIIADGVYDIGVSSGFASGSSTPSFSVCINGLAFTADIAQFKPGAALVSASSDGTLSVMSYALEAADTVQIGAFQFQNTGSAALNTSAESRLLIRKVG